MDQIWQETVKRTSLREIWGSSLLREICKMYYEEKEVCDANVARNSHPIRVRHSL